jgi:hypothetical protein
MFLHESIFNSGLVLPEESLPVVKTFYSNFKINGVGLKLRQCLAKTREQQLANLLHILADAFHAALPSRQCRPHLWP